MARARASDEALQTALVQQASSWTRSAPTLKSPAPTTPKLNPVTRYAISFYISTGVNVTRHAFALAVSNGWVAITNALSYSTRPLTHKISQAISIGAVAVASRV